MNEKLEKLKPSEKNLATYLFAAAVLFRTLPYLLETLILMLGRRALPQPAYFALEYSAILILPLAALCLWGAVGYGSRREGLAGAAGMAFAYVLETAGGTILQEKVLVQSFDRQLLYYGMLVLLLLVGLLVLLWAFPGSRRKMKGNLWIVGVLAGRLLVLLAVDRLVALCAGWLQPSFGSNVLLRAITALIDACALTLIFRHIEKAEVTKNWRVRLIVAPVGIAACLVCQLILLHTNPLDRISAGIAEDLAYGAAELAAGNVETASEWFHMAQERRDAWEYTTGATDHDRLYDGRSATTLEARYLYWQYRDDLDAMERCLLEEEVGLDYAVSLLRVYAGLESELSGRSKALQTDTLTLMVAQGVFTDDVLTIGDLEEQKFKLTKKLADFDRIDIYCEAVDILTETGRTGGVSVGQMEDMLELAEQNPQDLSLQYFAVVYGCACKSDGASHYDRTMEAAERFVNLYEKQIRATDDQKYQCRWQLINWALELGLYERATEYCEEALQAAETEEVLMVLAQCQNELGRTEDCYETAQRILKQYPENSGAVYYCAIAELQKNDIDAAIRSAEKLSSMVQELTGEERHRAEVMFYDVIQRQSFNDAGYNTMIYRKLTEEQRALIDKDAFYADYLDAAYLCFSERDYEASMEKLSKVLEKEPGLSQANYLKGCIYFGMEQYEKAAEAYREALSIDDTAATAWYSLANAYDALGRYEEAYEACARVSALLPDTDHLFDPYGVAIHNNNLKRRLAQELGIRED